MTLRARVALVALGVTIPVLAATAWLTRALREREALEQARALVLDRMEGGGRESCEADPEGFGRPWDRARARGPRRRGGRLRFYAYDRALVPASPSAPRLGEQVARRLRSGDEVAAEVAASGPARVRRVAVAMPWREGPCAVVLVEHPLPPGARRAPWPAALLPVLVAFGVVGVVVIALGPTVRRLRRLTDAVRRSVDEGYAPPTALPGGHDEVGELAAAFERAAREVRDRMAQLSARDAALTQFLANTTHDVMIPLTVLQGHLAAFERAVAEGRAPDRDRVQEAIEEAHYLGALLQNLRLAARLEAGAPDVARHPVDLGAVVERVVARHAPLARQRGVALEHATPEAPVELEGDVTLLEQALGNLVHNAIRYNRAAGHVAVVLERAPRGFRLRVLDDGPGLSPADLARVTERGVRGDAARARAPSGLGLGLHIARTVAEAHGLALELAARDEGGLEVTLAPRGGQASGP